jgi:hypothetical protein
MSSARLLESSGRWWVSAGAALLVHAAAAFALSDLEGPPSRPSTHVVWLSALHAVAPTRAQPSVSTEQRGGPQAQVPADARAVDLAPGAAGRARSSRRTTHAASRPTSAAPSPTSAPIATETAPIVREASGVSTPSTTGAPLVHPASSDLASSDLAHATIASLLTSRSEPSAPAREPANMAEAAAAGPSAHDAAGGARHSRAAGGAGSGTAVRRPGLLAQRNPCSGYFPVRANADHGQVQLSVHVDAAGHARADRLLLESPRGQGFGQAARACASALHFAPAVDAHGMPVKGVAKLELRFDRSLPHG